MTAEKARVDPTRLKIRKLDDIDQPRLAAFDCGDGDLNEFLRDDASRLQREGTAVTHLAFYEGEMRGYITLSMDAIPLKQTERKKAFATRIDYPVVPAVKIARLACESAFRNRCGGLGREMVRFAAATALEFGAAVGCRLLTVDAYAAAAAFYEEKLGFVRNREKSLQKNNGTTSMRLDLFAPDSPLWR